MTKKSFFLQKKNHFFNTLVKIFINKTLIKENIRKPLLEFCFIMIFKQF